MKDKGLERLGLEFDELARLIIFVRKFKMVFEKDFYTDPLASILLRHLHIETEMIE